MVGRWLGYSCEGPGYLLVLPSRRVGGLQCGALRVLRRPVQARVWTIGAGVIGPAVAKPERIQRGSGPASPQVEGGWGWSFVAR